MRLMRRRDWLRLRDLILPGRLWLHRRRLWREAAWELPPIEQITVEMSRRWYRDTTTSAARRAMRDRRIAGRAELDALRDDGSVERHEAAMKRFKAGSLHKKREIRQAWQAIGPMTMQESAPFLEFLPDPLVKRGRPVGAGFFEADAPLVDEIARRVAAGEAPRKVAKELALGAEGGGTTASKVRRLMDRYRDQAGEKNPG